MRNFANSIIIPFQGATGAQAITAHKKSNQPPQAVSLDIPWRAYALQMNIGVGVTTFNGAVSIDLARGTVSNPLDIVKSVFIDNTSVDRPVYLRCEDTGQVVTCADGSTGFFPLLTFGEQFTLFTDNIIPLRDGNQRTKIIFSNASFDTFAGGELNRAQQLFRASGSSQFITPVLGDQYAAGVLSLGGSGTTATTIIDLGAANTQRIITGLRISLATDSSGDTSYTHFNPISLVAGAKTIISSTVRVQGSRGFIDVARSQSMQLDANGTSDLVISAYSGPQTNSTGIAIYEVVFTKIQLPALSA